jgi:hypothetical protein
VKHWAMLAFLPVATSAVADEVLWDATAPYALADVLNNGTVVVRQNSLSFICSLDETEAAYLIQDCKPIGTEIDFLVLTALREQAADEVQEQKDAAILREQLTATLDAVSDSEIEKAIVDALTSENCIVSYSTADARSLFMEEKVAQVLFGDVVGTGVVRDVLGTRYNSVLSDLAKTGVVGFAPDGSEMKLLDCPK